MKNSRLSICHIISGDLWAGAEVMAFNLLKSLAGTKDISIIAIVMNEGRLASEIRNLGIETHVIDERTNSFLRLFFKVRGLVRSRGVQIMHTHRYKENLLAFLVSIVVGKTRIAATLHGMPEFYTNKQWSFSKLYLRLDFFLLSRFFNRVFFVSSEMKDTCIRTYGFRNSHSTVIHNGIHLIAAPDNRTNRTSFTVGSSGRLFPVKNYRLMVEIARLTADTPGIRFRLAGDGPEREMLESLIREYNLENTFELCGHIDDIDSFYTTLDLYVNTSLHEGIPMSIIEAMSHGLPVIAPGIGGIPEIINDGAEGFLIEGRDAGGFADKCRLLHGNKPLYVKMAGCARSRTENGLSAQKMAEKYHETYCEIVG